MDAIDVVDGQALAVYDRAPAWHGLGTVITDGGLTLTRALEEARLARWNVRRGSSEGAGIETVIRTNPVNGAPEVIAEHVPADVTLIQNEDAFGWTQSLTGRQLAVDCAGSLHGGTETWMLFKLPEHLTIAGAETVQPYLAALNCHSGRRRLTAMLTAVRIVCANTQNLALTRPSPRYELPIDVECLDNRKNDARATLAAQIASDLNQYHRQAEDWLNARVSRPKLRRILTDLGTLGFSPHVVLHLHDAAATQEGIRGTAWGVLQAAWEFDEHYTGTERDVVDLAFGGLRRSAAAQVIAEHVRLPDTSYSAPAGDVYSKLASTRRIPEDRTGHREPAGTVCSLNHR